MAEGVTAEASRASADGKPSDRKSVSSSEIQPVQLPGDAEQPREQQEQPEYDDATVERVYRKLDLRIIPGESGPGGVPVLFTPRWETKTGCGL